mmetsp:Transcript_12847/g.51678  ORF Transcript_12847/g.51678 Transcript_12847/m.51678 type:complete len:227 (-) Transcript_12847:1011-1691(-)
MKYAGVQLPSHHVPVFLGVEQRQLPGARPRAQAQYADRMPAGLVDEKRRQHREQVKNPPRRRLAPGPVLGEHGVLIGRSHQQRRSRERHIPVVIVHAHHLEQPKVARVLLEHRHPVDPRRRSDVKLRGRRRVPVRPAYRRHHHPLVSLRRRPRPVRIRPVALQVGRGRVRSLARALVPLVPRFTGARTDRTARTARVFFGISRRVGPTPVMNKTRCHSNCPYENKK